MYFANCVVAGIVLNVITPEYSMAAMETVLAAQKSAESGEIVRLG